MRVRKISPYMHTVWVSLCVCVCGVCLDAVKQNVGSRMFSEISNFEEIVTK